MKLGPFPLLSTAILGYFIGFHFGGELFWGVVRRSHSFFPMPCLHLFRVLNFMLRRVFAARFVAQRIPSRKVFRWRAEKI
jgi:hypothetical protein